MSKKKYGKQSTFFIDMNPHRKIQRFTHASMPLRLYEHLFRTACEWAINGDAEASQWVMDELLVLDRIHETSIYQGSRTRKEFRKYIGLPCVMCGKPADSVDHIIPISRGGTNAPTNLQPMCKSCNSKKGAKI